MLPLQFDETKLKAMHDAVVHRQSYVSTYVSIKTKAFSLSVSSLIPAQLQPMIALIESPQVCSPKFLTCEQRSV